MAPKAWSWAALGGWRWGMELTAGDEGEAAGSEGVNQKGRRIPREDVTDARAGWAGEGRFQPVGRRGQWAG
jgi:hypothetical protein